MDRGARILVSVVMFVGLALSALPASAAPASGQLDPTFNIDGRVLLPDAAIGVEVLDNGKSLVVDSASVVRRYLVDGTLDLGYGDHGRAQVLTPAGSPIGATDAALQTDGKLVLVGTYSPDGQTEVEAVARLTPGGSPDPTFSGDGVKTFSSSVFSSEVDLSIAVAPSGRILLCGTTPPDIVGTSAGDVGVIALKTTGRRVASFGGGNGLATVDFSGALDVGEGITVQSDGKIVLVATTFTPGESERRMGVARLDAVGVLDPSFNGDGRVRVSFRSEVELWGGTWGRDVSVHPVTGDIYVGGDVYNAVSEEEFFSFAVARFGPTALLEQRWTSVGSDRSARLFAIDLIGQDVVAVGLVEISSVECCGWFVVRFGSVQYAIEEYFGQLTDQASDVEVVDGKAYVAGYVWVTSGGRSWRGGSARFIA